uniref:HTH CENPB-type domain-containing protein n=1 Tax=Amphimedon queenslandica TaxID=400682 RepID=A0A1X7V775_AMPQE
MASVPGFSCSKKSSTRNELTLKERVDLIDYQKKNPATSSRKLAEIFKCGRTQVLQVLKKKDTIFEQFKSNAPGDRKRKRGTQFEEINDAVFTWYSLARQRNVPISGPKLQEEAMKIAEKLSCSSQFKASNGWLQSFKKHHKLKQLTVSGEAADVSEETVENWHERLKLILAGYKAEDIWNEDETGCFYRALPEKTLAEKKECRGGKKSKDRITVAFFANSAGGKEAPIVIGKHAKPRCFKGLNNIKQPAGIPYYSNQKAWMNTDIMNNVLSTLNQKLGKQKRNILLLLDNVSSHDPALKNKFSNIKVVFLPKNTTSKLQPLDAGIIKNFKVHYRRLLQHTLSKIDTTDLTASAIAKSIDILTAIRGSIRHGIK